MNTATKVFNKMMETDHFSKWLGLKPIRLETGVCIIKMKVKKEMLNGFSILHGGVAFSLADSALAFVANSYEKLAITINGSMSYLESVKEGDVLIATATPEKIGSKIAHFNVEIKEEKTEKTVYTFKGTVFRTEKTVV